MSIKISVVTSVVISAAALIVCGISFAQGPINNALQFQEKAIKSALRGSKNQNFETRRDSIRWANNSYMHDANDTGTDDDVPAVNTQVQEEVVTK
jgi:hypothetical protein